MNYKVELVFGVNYYEEAQRIITWAQKNCPSYITNKGISYISGALVSFYFVNEQDAMWFKLKYADKVYED